MEPDAILPGPARICVEGLSVQFVTGRFRRTTVDALTRVDLHAVRGEVVAILGPNGSGKTTLFRTLVGECRPREGHVEVLGDRPGSRGLVGRIGLQPDGPIPYPGFRAIDFLHHIGLLLGLERAWRHEQIERLTDALALAPIARRRIGGLSTGMQQRLALAAALLSAPDVLLLDEPTSGLDPIGSRLVLDLLRAEAERGTTVLMASHRLDEVHQIADRVVILLSGRVVADGSLDVVLGGSDAQWTLRGVTPALRAKLEAVAEDGGAVSLGWQRVRRDPHEVFRSLGADSR
ncbi:MAG: ABC transporter ATP-binding protein [Planctomycetota bacterium]